MGYEVAQDNAAYILSKSFCPLSFKYEDVGIDGDTGRNMNGLIPERSEWSDHHYTGDDDDMEEDSERSGDSGDNTVEMAGGNHGNDGNGEESTQMDRSKIACEVRSLLLLSLSAAQGSPDAYLRVGDMLYYGKAGIEGDKASAARYYMLAADLRNSHAIFNLGLMHEVVMITYQHSYII
jgi:TPR repeat protein